MVALFSIGENTSLCFSMSMLSCKFINFITDMRKCDCCILHNWAPKSHILSSSYFLNEIILLAIYDSICKMIYSNDNIKKQSVKETCSGFCELPLRFILLYLINLPQGVCIKSCSQPEATLPKIHWASQHEK